MQLLWIVVALTGYIAAEGACPCKLCGSTTMCHKMGLGQVPRALPSRMMSRLLLYGNNITALRAGDFQSTYWLTELDLHDNLIVAIHVDAFKGLQRLESLHLSGNKITTIAPQTFTRLDKLSGLYLDSNRLRTLPGDIPFLTTLTRLNLADNEIRSAEWSSFFALRRLESINLRSNPLTCDCDTLELKRWLTQSPRGKSVTSDRSLNRCLPQNLTETCVQPEILSVSFISDNTAPTSSVMSTVQSGTALLHCNASGNPLPLLVWKTPTVGYVYPRSKGRVKAYANGTLRIDGLRKSDSGEYACHPQLHMPLHLRSDALKLEVVQGVKPSITHSSDKTQAYGGSALTLRCEATGSPRPAIEWYPPKSMRPLQTINFTAIPSVYEIKDRGAELVIKSFGDEHKGLWRCRAHNTLGFDAAYIEATYVADGSSLTLILVATGCAVVAVVVAAALMVTCHVARKHRLRNQTLTHQLDTRVVEVREDDQGYSNDTFRYPGIDDLQQPYTQEPEVRGIRI